MRVTHPMQACSGNPTGIMLLLAILPMSANAGIISWFKESSDDRVTRVLGHFENFDGNREFISLGYFDRRALSRVIDQTKRDEILQTMRDMFGKKFSGHKPVKYEVLHSFWIRLNKDVRKKLMTKTSYETEISRITRIARGDNPGKLFDLFHKHPTVDALKSYVKVDWINSHAKIQGCEAIFNVFDMFLTRVFILMTEICAKTPRQMRAFIHHCRQNPKFFQDFFANANPGTPVVENVVDLSTDEAIKIFIHYLKTVEKDPTYKSRKDTSGVSSQYRYDIHWSRIIREEKRKLREKKRERTAEQMKKLRDRGPDYHYYPSIPDTNAEQTKRLYGQFGGHQGG